MFIPHFCTFQTWDLVFQSKGIKSTGGTGSCEEVFPANMKNLSIISDVQMIEVASVILCTDQSHWFCCWVSSSTTSTLKHFNFVNLKYKIFLGYAEILNLYLSLSEWLHQFFRFSICFRGLSCVIPQQGKDQHCSVDPGDRFLSINCHFLSVFIEGLRTSLNSSGRLSVGCSSAALRYMSLLVAPSVSGRAVPCSGWNMGGGKVTCSGQRGSSDWPMCTVRSHGTSFMPGHSLKSTWLPSWQMSESLVSR